MASTTSVSPGDSSRMRRLAIVSGRGQASPRASTVVTIAIVTLAPELAAILSTSEPERLYPGLSVLVSCAAEGSRCAGLASFGALRLLLDPDLGERVQDPQLTPSLAAGGRATFARSLAELVQTARELDGLAIYACSASVQTMELEQVEVEQRLDGVMSTPRFLRDTAGARLLFV